jgi:hypothetical protein
VKSRGVESIPVTKAFKRIIGLRSILAFGLMLWFAGTGCMMVSYARAAVTESEAVAGLMSQAMAGSMSMDAHACCKAKRSSTKRPHTRSESRSLSPELNLLNLPSTPTPSGVMNCCPLTSGSIVVASRSQSNDNASLVQQSSSSLLLLIKSDPSPLAVPLRLPNRAHSYLLDCAFLI